MDELKKEGQNLENQSREAANQDIVASSQTTDAENAANQVDTEVSKQDAVTDNTKSEKATVDKKSNTDSDSGNTSASRKRTFTGKVTSDKADKTIVVATIRQVKHPLYKKYYKKTKKLMAHDENNICKIGDTVKIIEHRPLSARKRWMLVEVLEKAK